VTDPTVLLDMRDVTLGYGGRPVLAHVTLQVRRGEFWFVLGPNGSGKTTLLRAILDILPARAGTVHTRVRREQTGFVPQRCDLNPALPTTVREFVLLGTVGVRTTRSDEAEQLEWALARTGLAGMGRHDYWSLSGGQRQRALVARALVRRPSFLILDEPASNLDRVSEESLLRLLAELNRAENVTLLFVTHDIDLAARYATHVALAGAGTVLAGRCAEVLTPAHLTRAFGAPIELPAP
jgi:ABC-type Mn2+/Zn2+ transport system ATPase subunit